MDNLIDGIQRKRETLPFILKLTVAALAAFGAGYILRCAVDAAKSAPLEPTAEAVSRRITTVDSLWTCPIHPDCPLSKLNSWVNRGTPYNGTKLSIFSRFRG